MRYYDSRKSDWSTGVGPTVSLLLGALFVAFLSIGSFVLHMNTVGWQSNNTMTMPLVLNWYWVTTELADSGLSGTFFNQAIWYLLFALLKILVIGIAFAVASRELLVRPIAVPERVQIENQKPISSNVAVGESIDEIFGELKSKS